MRSLWLKIVAVLALAILVAVGIAAFSFNTATTGSFRVYLTQGGQRRAQFLAPVLEEYYAQNQTWQGVGDFLDSYVSTGTASTGTGRGRGPGPHGGGPPTFLGDRVIIADAQNHVVADTTGVLVGETLTASELEASVPLTVNDVQVGEVLVTAPGMQQGPEAQFLSAVSRGLLWGGLAAALVALALGGWLAFRLTSPLRGLTKAARRVQAGDLSQRVDVRSKDEAGELAVAFNEMASTLQANEQVRRNMVADIAHELRTPLTAIRGNLEAIMDDVFPASKESVAPIYDQTLMLSRLVDDLRELALAEAGQLPLKLEDVDVVEVLNSVAAAMQAQASGQGVEIRLDTPGALPHVRADSMRVRQALMNLVGNALRYTPEGGTITLSARRNVDAITVSVSDTGPGITPEDLPYVFDRFYRGDPSRSRSTGGYGLGLAIVKRWVEAHGGRVWAENNPEGGARVSFTLPTHGRGS